MMIIAAACITLLTAYVLLFVVYRYGWYRQASYTAAQSAVPRTFLSVVIAARNESANILPCVHSILAQDYPEGLFELIVVDDCSTDDTAELVRNVGDTRVRLIRLADQLQDDEAIRSYKKKALSVGVAASRGMLVLTTDADCIAPPQWLRTVALYYEQSGAAMIISPVRLFNDFSVLQLFQSLDFLTMQGITAATVRLNLGIMCNGANLAFRREAFLAVGGYNGVDHIVSGDDYLLQMKIKRAFPDGVRYLRSSAVIVDTQPQYSWRGFLQQRIRWASKTGQYEDTKTTFILALIYLFNVSLFVFSITAWYHNTLLSLLLLVWCTKILVEIVFLYPVTGFFQRKKELLFFALLQPLHIVYIIVAGFLSKIRQFEWKERKAVR